MNNQLIEIRSSHHADADSVLPARLPHLAHVTYVTHLTALAASVLLLSALAGFRAYGVQPEVLYAFPGAAANPQGELVQGRDGYFYGTTANGGAGNYGTVFRMATNGTLTTLASFAGTNGAAPEGKLTLGRDGYFYGTTFTGGKGTNGTIFRMDTNGVLTRLVSFAYTNGANPTAGLVQGSDGNFYGTTSNGGTSTNGTVFRMTAGGVLTTLVYFTSAKGAKPAAPLVQGRDGNFYGTTAFGGAHGDGTVFRMTPSGALTTLVSFTGANGDNPSAGLVQASDGNFYGTTSTGGTNSFGTVFRMKTTGALTTLVSFYALSNGAFPYAGLVQGTDGNLYGTTGFGTNSYGSVFRVSTNGVFATLASFSGANGKEPLTGLVQGSDGNLYGTTSRGGTNDNGTVFRVSTNGALTSLVSFGSTIAANPQAGLVQGRDGYFYGTSLYGGTNNQGTVYRIDTNGVLAMLVSFTGTNGASPYERVVQGRDGNFYGTTFFGGASGNGMELSGYGTVFRMNASGALTNLHNFNLFNPPEGGYPSSDLVQGSDGHFYGTTGAGGAHGKGTVFRMDTNGVLTTLVSFAGTNGQSPSGGLLEGSDGNFYGTTSGGGANKNGTMFRMGTNGVLTTLFSFAGTNGSNPTADLVRGSDGYFYGTTYNGGPSDDGTGFRMDTNGVLTTLGYFVGTNGMFPNSPLVQGTDGYFYGTTWGGGESGYGVVFRMEPNGGLATVFSFGLTNGHDPVGLLQASDGSFYGTTAAGGEGGGGVVFRFKLDSAIVAEPMSQTAGVGSSVTFSVSVQGTMPFSYQWLFNGHALAGETNATLTLNNVSADQAGAYSVIVSNSAGVETSASANLVVTQPTLAGAARLPDGNIQLTLVGPSNVVWAVEAATNLAAPIYWMLLTTVTASNGVAHCYDLSATNRPHTFYRVVWPYDPYAAAGLVLIPAGSFTMGNSIGDSDITDANPTSVSVSAFYMETNLVSYSQWQSVYSYATNQGYGFDHPGSGKAANHPVQTLNWYDAVKWCNARSQQAALAPAYYTDAGLTQIYTNGQADPYVNWAANGFGLPTEAEWERAARGGLSGLRFPWGNTITPSQANYYGNPGVASYDLGPSGYNPAYTNGGTPYTSPVGSFPANGYALTTWRAMSLSGVGIGMGRRMREAATLAGRQQEPPVWRGAAPGPTSPATRGARNALPSALQRAGVTVSVFVV